MRHFGKLGAIHHLAQADDGYVGVGYLHPDGRLAGDGRLYTHTGGRHAQRNIARQADHAADAHAGVGRQLIARYSRAAADVDHLAGYAKAVQRLLQPGDALQHFIVGVLRCAPGRIQQMQGRFFILTGLLLVLVVCHGYGLRIGHLGGGFTCRRQIRLVLRSFRQRRGKIDRGDGLLRLVYGEKIHLLQLWTLL